MASDSELLRRVGGKACAPLDAMVAAAFVGPAWPLLKILSNKILTNRFLPTYVYQQILTNRCAVADRSIRDRDQQAAYAEAATPRVGREQELSVEPLPLTVADIPCPSLEPHKSQVFGWLRGIAREGTTTGFWLCGYQLLAHFQSTTGLLGY